MTTPILDGAPGSEVLARINSNVVGPASSTDNAITRFDGITGKAIQGGTAAPTYDDSGNVGIKTAANSSFGLLVSSGVSAWQFNATVGGIYWNNNTQVISFGTAHCGARGTTPTTAQKWGVENTYTSATNFERFSIAWANNLCTLSTEKGGDSGTQRPLALSAGTETIRLDLVSIPTTDPVVAGALWRDGTDLKISLGA